MNDMRNIPFFSNTKDDTHCFQASLKMALAYFWPKRRFSWQELDRISKKVKGLWTWPLAALIWCAKNEMEVRSIETFDYPDFIKKGGKYLIETFGEEMGKAQIGHSDIDQERRVSKDFIKYVRTEKRTPSLQDIKNLIREGFLIVCNVNARVLSREPGYAGHFVVIVGLRGDHIILHDPGLPPLKNRRVTRYRFEKAWAYPDARAKNIMAFKI